MMSTFLAVYLIENYSKFVDDLLSLRWKIYALWTTCLVFTFWERAAHSVDYMFSFLILVSTRFGFEGEIWVLFAPAPGQSILVSFNYRYEYNPTLTK